MKTIIKSKLKMKAISKKTILTAMLSFAICIQFTNAQIIGAGGWHSLVICSDGTVKTFGENATGQLGNGNYTDQSNPVTPSGLTNVIGVSGGGDQLEAHSMALKSDGTVWAWGSNIYGALGNATTTSTNTPGQVLLISDVKAISAGGWHSVALKNDGTVWTWGWNIDGQIGDGTNTDRLIVTQVPGLTGITKIAAGTYHVLALKSDGTVWAWGDNVSGQIGDNSTTDRSSPVQVSGLTNVTSIAAGRFYSLAVKSDSTVWTWGENLYGQLGDGTTVDKHVPVQVPGLTGVVDAVVANGAFHTMVLKSDNTVWAWGRNTYGNLGDNTTVHRSSPVQMIGMSDVTSMASGTNFSLLAKSDGTFWGCGRNASGQLGDGTVTQHNIATQSTPVCFVMQPVGISDHIAEGIEFSVYPNPSNGIFNLQLEKDEYSSLELENVKLEVYNSIGENILQSNLNYYSSSETISVDLSQQPTGIYFIKINSGKYVFNQKLIKQ